MVKTRPRPSAIEFNNILTAAVKMEQYSVALHMFDEMLRRDAPTDHCTFNIAINCFCLMKRADFGFAVLGSIFKRGYEPAVLTFRALIHGLLLVGKSLDAAKLLKRLLTEEWFKPDANTCLKMITMFATPDMLSLLEKGRRKPHVYPYNPVIHCLCNDGMVDEALQLISVMDGKGILLDAMIYNSIIQGLCNFRRWDEVEEMLKKMVASKIHPDVYTFNILLDALCEEGMVDATENIFKMMRKGEMVEAQGLGILQLVVKSGIKPDITSYNVVMDGYLKMGRVNEVSRIFNEIPTKGLERNVVSYGIML
ncbi:putative pentatricopeptide repeat-containing protein At1g12700, mitochondrial [Salvia miltiorrhiza]|uniref:putative pentatricopeptide repeat-containing protein At1g12700, mitochondrial n=1 Tax=Salvia miltiorrhiza TaxID=226208 RepID=UPI0025AC44B4|nr:putative pentatricopeptide repeat-containing protein At1g12700, mitochondrial [Salvia miltiorrhiza]